MTGAPETTRFSAVPAPSVGGPTHHLRSRLTIWAAIAATTLVVACGSAPEPRIVRRIGGERRAGAFVSPHQYEWFVRGEIATAYGRHEEAAEAYRMALAGAEEDPLVLARLAETLDQLGQREEAERLLAEAHESQPGSESLWLATARIAARRGDADRAIAAYQRAQQAAPDSETAPIELARLLRDRGAAERADSVLESFATRAGGGTAGASRARLALALARGDAAAAAASVESLLRVAPARADEVREAAETALSGGRPDVAVRLLERVPRRAGDEELRVRALIEAGRGDEAEGLLAAAPDDAFASLLEEARLLLAIGRPERAEELAATAAQTGGGPLARVVEGRAALAQGRFVEAAAAFGSVARGAEGFAAARIGLAETLAAQGLDALAVETLAHTIETGTDDDEAVRAALERLRSRRSRR